MMTAEASVWYKKDSYLGFERNEILPDFPSSILSKLLINVAPLPFTVPSIKSAIWSTVNFMS